MDKMTLIDRLRNPMYVHTAGAPVLAVERTVADMKEAADLIERLQRKAGAVSDGESFEEIRRLARAGAPMVKYDNSLIKADRIVDKPSDTE